MSVNIRLLLFTIVIFPVLSLMLLSKPVYQDYVGIRQQSEDSLIHIHSKKVKKDGTGADEDSYGTGFIVDKEGYVLTASHVVLKADSQTLVETTVSLRSKQGTRYKVETVKRDDEVDLILLVLPDVGTNWKPLKLGDSKSTPKDEPLYTLGFPGNSDLSSATGILSNKSAPNGTWQTTLPINRGNSGGPVFDRKGRVVAIAKAGDDAQQGKTYVIPSSFISFVMPKATQIILENEKDTKEVESFHFPYQFGEKPGEHYWTRISKDIWTESYPTGAKAKIRVIGQITVEGDNGLLLENVDNNIYEYFIPYKGGKRMWLRIRLKGEAWGVLGEMKDIQ